jgi:hypothetical protein
VAARAEGVLPHHDRPLAPPHSLRTVLLKVESRDGTCSCSGACRTAACQAGP